MSAHEQPAAATNPAGRRLRITFTVTDSQLAHAMVLAVRDDTAIDFGDTRAVVSAVNRMSRVAADRALRDALWAYGALSWPDVDDWLTEPLRAARSRVAHWRAA